MATILLSLLATWEAAAAPPQAFVAGSYAQLMERQHDKAFVLGFWSLDCPPCYRELAFWGEQRRKGAMPTLVLVSTDTPADAAEIDALLARYGLEGVESWVFAAPEQQLRYEIDRQWQGELPRTYFVERGVVVDATTGVIDAAQVASWLSARP